MLETINTSMDNSTPKSGKHYENLKVHACLNENTMRITLSSKIKAFLANQIPHRLIKMKILETLCIFILLPVFEAFFN